MGAVNRRELLFIPVVSPAFAQERAMRKINKIFVHCSATPEGRDIKAETIRQWHLDRGWSDIGYHFVIELNGTIRTGRPLEIAGAHARGHNRYSIGVCYVGGLDVTMKPKDTRTAAQQESLIGLLEYLHEEYPDATLHGHNEVSAKACPSFTVAHEEELQEIFED